MAKMMFRVDASRFSFDETVAKLTEQAEASGWRIPAVHDLQAHYISEGLEDMTKLKILYFCNPQGGYKILTSADSNKAMSVMMPIGVSVFETSTGEVQIAALNLGLMNNFFGGVVKEVLRDSGARYAKSVEGIIV
jgi:uncharacterized protein (DUF302 family)